MDTKNLWQQVQEELKISVSKAIFQTLFQGTSLVSLKNNVATIGCPSSYIQGLIETRYYSLIKDILDRKTNKDNSLVFVVRLLSTNEKKSLGPLFEKEKEFVSSVSTCGLRPDFTFENFCVSSVNQLPYAAATAVARNPGDAYNPLFLWGGVGVGKTHLMQAIGHEILKNHPQTKVIYCMGEEFTNEIIQAIRLKTTDVFKKKYRSAQVLLLDDVQFIAGKTTVQEEFFHTFNAIQREGGQIVLVSDRPPEEISKLEERLRSRFEGGLIIDIPVPDFELRSAILLTKAKQRGINLPMDVAQIVASNIDSTRKLEGFLIRLQNESETKKIPISPELVQSLLGKAIETQELKKILKPKEIIEIVASHFNLKIGDLKGQKRIKKFVFPRQISMYILRTEANLPLMTIAELLGGRDHTTIMHGVEKITKLLSENEDLRVDISGIKQKLYS
ncbi:MAG: chromosomal replication initiator protein DnaA [Patescibacteria group bacterium]